MLSVINGLIVSDGKRIKCYGWTACSAQPTCFRAALASTDSVDSIAVATSPVGVPAVGVTAGERRGVEVSISSSLPVPVTVNVYKTSESSIIIIQSSSELFYFSTVSYNLEWSQ